MLGIAQELAEAFDGVVNSANPNLPLSEHWGLQFQTAATGPDLPLALSALHSKLIKVQKAINESEQPERAKALYLSAVSQLEPFISSLRVQQHSVSQVQNLRQQVDILHLAAAALPGNLVPEVNDLTIESLGEEITALINDVRDSNLPQSLKDLLSPPLETLLMAVRSYRILGPEGVTRVYGAAAAELVRISGVSAKAPEATKSKIRKAIELAKKAGAAIVWAAAVVNSASGMIEDGSTLLGLEGQTQEGKSNSNSKD